jgi:uncharacterized protein YfaS (alpha-2-macroglobulin family)
MSKRTLAAVLAGVAATAATATLLSCGSQPHRDLTVTAWSPQDTATYPSAIEVRFDRPVVDETKVGTAVDPGTVAIEPAIPWKGHWSDRQTLVVEPESTLAPATRYTVRLTGPLADRTGAFSFSFVNRPLELVGLDGADKDAVDPAGALRLSFNRDVDPALVAKHCTLRKGSDRVALSTSMTKPTDAVAVQTPKPLERGTTYTLGCDGLVAIGGNAAIDAKNTLELTVRPPLAVKKIAPDGADVPADEVAIEIELSSPVDLAAIRAAVHSVPEIAGLDAGYLDGSGTTYKVVADLDTETDYRIEVRELTDRYGDKLAGVSAHEFRTGDARPRISMERGLFALEASAKGYPVWSRNLPTYDVTCAAIPKASIVKLLTTDMNYDPWGGYNDSNEIEWDKLGVKAREVPVTIAGAKNKWHLDHLDLGKTCGDKAGARGVYLADVSAKEIADDADRPWWSPRTNRVLVNVTDLGVLIKEGPASGIVWVTSLATGKPVGGAKVIVYNPQGKQVWVAKTDASGLAKLPGSAKLLAQPSVDDSDDVNEEGWEDWDSYRSQRLIAVVEKGEDVAVVDGNWANGIQIWNFGVPEERRGGATQIRGFLQSDRGLYRPGETVHFKGIVREIAAGRAPKVPKRAPVSVEVTDARGSTVYSDEVRMSAFGGFSFDLPVATEAALGDWYVTAKVQDRVFRERFSVEEFRPTTFEVKLKGGEANARLGRPLDLVVDAQYLFGAPVADAEVTWTVNRRPHWLRFKGYDEYTFEDNGDRWWWWYEDRDEYGEFLSDGTATTDARGHAAISVRDEATGLTGPQDYVINATVTDDSDQAMSASRVFTAHQTDLYIGMHTQEYVQAVGMPFGVNLVAVAPDGKRTGTKAKLTMIKKVTDCTWQTVASRSYSSCTTRDDVALEREIAIPATGTLTERIYPKTPGDFLIKVETTDGRGNKVSTSSMVWVIGKGEAFWSGDEGARMTLIASKAKYEVGDTARLVAQANLVKPTALITIERDGVVTAEVRQMESAADGVELAIKDSYAPNVFASVAMVSGRHGDGDRNRPQFKMGVVELKVDSDHKRLDVKIELDEAKVRPGGSVSGKVVVTRGGKPVKAELSLGAADEGVLQLIAYQTPDPMRTFYAAWGLGVDSGTNWNRIARLADPEAGDPDEGGDVGGSSAMKVRSKFVSSAYWQPALVTDEQGVARFGFEAPDNLTAFRLMAVAADTSDGFGSGEARLTVDKPLMATPVLPRFVGAGDRLSVGVLVHNHTGKAGTAKLVAKADGLTLDDTTSEVAVPANGSARVRFAAKASQNAAATVEVAVRMNGEEDALRLTVPIRRPRILDTRMLATDAGSGNGATFAIASGKGVLADESVLAVTVDRTGMGDLEPSLRYLVEYPYGCLEQTLSRMVPLVAAKDLATSLGFQGLAKTKMNEFLKAGIAKVARHQQGDGHFSLWPQSDTHPHLTVYALWGLSVARQAGLDVPKETLDRGVDALAGWMSGTGTVGPGNEGATAAMAAWVLAINGKADATATQKLYELRASLPRWGQAFLLRAMIAAKSSETMIADVEKDLLAAITVSGDTASVKDGSKDDVFYMSSDARATAIVLDALLERNPDLAVLPKLAAGLKEMRRPDGHWYNTQDNLWSLVALGNYARHAAAGSGWVTISAGETQLAKKKLTGGEVLVVKKSLDQVSGKVTIKADKGMHWTARVTEARVDDGKAISAGFTITREYLDDQGKALSSVKAGQVVTVRLTLEAAATREWIALVDPLPAGLEALNPNLVTGDKQQTTSSHGSRYWQPPVWAHTEVRDDRVLWFADRMYDGTYVMSYKARATIDGTFAVPPASVEAMYEPDVRARTASTSFTVTK